MKSFASIIQDLSTERAFSHIEFLVDLGERIAGTPKMDEAARYVRDQLESYGLDARIDHFPIYHSYAKGAALRVISPETRVITAKPTCHIASTLPEGIEGEMIYANVGSYEDYEGLDVEGKIVLTGMTWAPARPEKARIAYEKGAKALVIMNWGTEDNPVIQMGGTKSQWGNPTPDSFKTIPQIPVISVTRAAGEYLRKLCEAGGVRVWLQAEATREWVEANQPVGVLRANRDTDEFVLVGGHLEAWGKTAVCNSSGNGAMLEMARVLAEHRDELDRNVIFAFWDGHEVAEAAGSAWFVDTNWDALTQHCLAYINIDNPGIRDTVIPGLIGVPESKALLEALADEIWDVSSTWDAAYKGGDNSFFGVGVPYLSVYTRYTPAELKRLNYASLSPTLHSDNDTIDKLDAEQLGRHMAFFTALVCQLANTPVIPYDLGPLADQVIDDMETLAALGGDSLLDGFFDSLLSEAQQFKLVAEQVNKARERADQPEQVSALNRVLLHPSRLLSPLLNSEAGRYGHDPYDYSLSKKPLPRLYAPVSKLVALDAGDDERYLWETQLLRERNRLSDALGDVVVYTQAMLAQIE